jgi:hypothetical protein
MKKIVSLASLDFSFAMDEQMSEFVDLSFGLFLAEYMKIVICACLVGPAVDQLEPIFSVDISINLIHIRQVILKLQYNCSGISILNA